MAAYKVILLGTGGMRYKRQGIFRKSSPRPFGFYTTRFVSASTPEEAGELATELVRPDAEPLTLAECPWKIVVDAVEEIEGEMPSQVRGFTFFPEQDR